MSDTKFRNKSELKDFAFLKKFLSKNDFELLSFDIHNNYILVVKKATQKFVFKIYRNKTLDEVKQIKKNIDLMSDLNIPVPIVYLVGSFNEINKPFLLMNYVVINKPIEEHKNYSDFVYELGKIQGFLHKSTKTKNIKEDFHDNIKNHKSFFLNIQNVYCLNFGELKPKNVSFSNKINFIFDLEESKFGESFEDIYHTIKSLDKKYLPIFFKGYCESFNS
jgi:hypothetical protein